MTLLMPCPMCKTDSTADEGHAICRTCESGRCPVCAQAGAPQCRCDDEAAWTPLEAAQDTRQPTSGSRLTTGAGPASLRAPTCQDCGTTWLSCEWDECPYCSTADKAAPEIKTIRQVLIAVAHALGQEDS